MANYLEANPDDGRSVADHRQTGQMVPIARDGALAFFVNRRHLDTTALASPLPAEDYVVGLELLGFVFRLATPAGGSPDIVFRREPSEAPPAGWDQQEMRIATAFGSGRVGEIVEFLRRRELDACVAECGL